MSEELTEGSPKPSAAASREGLRLTAELQKETAETKAFAQRVASYVEIVGHLMDLLGIVNSVGDMEKLFRFGTVLPDVQKTADQIESQSRGAVTEAQEIADSISLPAAVAEVSNAMDGADTQALFDLGGSLSDFSFELTEPAFEMQDLSNKLETRAQALRVLSDAYGTMTKVYQGESTSEASTFAMALSLQKLGGSLDNSSKHYREAGNTLNDLSEFTGDLAAKATGAAWRQVGSAVAREMAKKRTAPPSQSQAAP
jgi:hypothetical protein